ncbi:MAG: hypothetical protein R2851_02115 [Caldilineaceae bacterium]
MAIYRRLRERGYRQLLERCAASLNKLEQQPDVMVRVECKPGGRSTGRLRVCRAVAGSAHWKSATGLGLCHDPLLESPQCVEFVFDQKLATWLLLHRHAFEWFGGVPNRIVIDNLKAAVSSSVFDGPIVNRPTASAPNTTDSSSPLVASPPRATKASREQRAHYVKRNFLGGRRPTTIDLANREVRIWCLETAGQRIHGTTTPNSRWFVSSQPEQAQLTPLPAAPYDLAVWKVAKVGVDNYITFDNAYYSVPFRIHKGTKGAGPWRRTARDDLLRKLRTAGDA